MLANRKRTSLQSHCMALDSRRVALKMSAFYGENGVGVSSLFMAVGFLKRLVTRSMHCQESRLSEFAKL